MNPLRWFTFIFLTALIAACSSQSSQVSKDLTKSLDDNKSAKTEVEWAYSESKPELLFQKWHEKKYEPEQICEAFLKQRNQDIAFFEDQIRFPENAALIAPCKEELLKRVELYWTEQKAKIYPPSTQSDPREGEKYQFPVNEQFRDTQQGYQAVTGDIQKKEVILSFDDGPHPQYTQMILEALDQVNAKALFFSLGKNAVQFPDALRKVGAAGHSVGSHSMDHLCLAAKPICEHHNGRMLTTEEAIKDIEDGHHAVEAALGWVDPFFRFPYGETSPELNAYLKSHGIGAFFWNIDSEDWKNTTPQEMIETTISQLDRLGRGLIIMHDVHRKTAETLPALLKQFYFRGYSVVLIKPTALMNPAPAPSPAPVP